MVPIETSLTHGGASLNDFGELAQSFLQEIKRASRVLVGSHLNPDGDALGSALAVSLMLDTLGIENEVLSHHVAPKNLAFLPGADRIRLHPLKSGHDLAVVVDLDALDRLGQGLPYFTECPRMIVVDHHIPHQMPGDVRIVDTTAPATSLILTRLFLELGLEITPEIATCLLTGIVTDTGSFRFRNTTPEALNLSAVLLEKGGDMNEVMEEIYRSTPVSAARLLGRVFTGIKLACDDRLGWAVITHGDFVETGSSDEDTEGFANEVLSIDSVQIAILIRETKPNKVRVSLRSRRGFDVAAVARNFGGGGHTNAAGCNFELPIQEAVDLVVAKAKECLESC